MSTMNAAPLPTAASAVSGPVTQSALKGKKQALSSCSGFPEAGSNGGLCYGALGMGFWKSPGTAGTCPQPAIARQEHRRSTSARDGLSHDWFWHALDMGSSQRHPAQDSVSLFALDDSLANLLETKKNHPAGSFDLQAYPSPDAFTPARDDAEPEEPVLIAKDIATARKQGLDVFFIDLETNN